MTNTTAAAITGENYALQSAEPSEALQVSLLFDSSPIHISLITQSWLNVTNLFILHLARMN